MTALIGGTEIEAGDKLQLGIDSKVDVWDDELEVTAQKVESPRKILLGDDDGNVIAYILTDETVFMDDCLGEIRRSTGDVLATIHSVEVETDE